MRILVGADVPKDPDSGAAGTVYHTNNALRELGHEVDEIWAPDLGRKIQHGNLHYLLELPRSYRDVVRERTKTREYDVVQLSQPHAYLAAQFYRKTRQSGIFINRSHGLEPRIGEVVKIWQKRLIMSRKQTPAVLLSFFMQKLLSWHWPKVLKASDGIILCCEDDRKYLLSHFPIQPEKVEVIHHGVAQSFLDQATLPMTDGRMRRILHVAQFSFFKGPHVLTSVMNKILNLFPDITFTWVCSSFDHAEIMSLFEPAVHNRVYLKDCMQQEKLISVYDRHGIFVFPSFAEGAAKSILEAMARGLCVVASNGSGMKDYITHQENGFLVPVGDVDVFVVSVEKLLASLDQCEKISMVARSAALQYTWRNCAQKTVSFYEELISRKRSLKIR